MIEETVEAVRALYDRLAPYSWFDYTAAREDREGCVLVVHLKYPVPPSELGLIPDRLADYPQFPIVLLPPGGTP